MFDFTEKDYIRIWLEGAKKGLIMKIDCESTKNIIKQEIVRIRKESEKRIKDLESLLNDSRYFK